MARFDRKVERTKKSFEFTQKEKIVETNKDVFKKNFTFKWVQLNIKTVCVFLVDFLLVTLLIIPFMMQYRQGLIKLFSLSEKTWRKISVELSETVSRKKSKSSMLSRRWMIYRQNIKKSLPEERNLGEPVRPFYAVRM